MPIWKVSLSDTTVQLFFFQIENTFDFSIAYGIYKYYLRTVLRFNEKVYYCNVYSDLLSKNIELYNRQYCIYVTPIINYRIFKEDHRQNSKL